MAESGHQFVNTYRAPLPGGQVISQERPGEKIARAITEIQEVIENMQGTDGEGESIAENANLDDSSVVDYKVLQMQGGVAIFDFVRATA